MRLVVEAHAVGHLRYVHLILTNKLRGLLEAQVADELAGGYAGYLLHLAVQLGAAYADVGRQVLHVEVGV